MRRFSRKVAAASRAAMKLLFRPMVSAKRVQMTKTNGNEKKLTWGEFYNELTLSKIESWMFPNMPEHYPVSKKLALAKSQSIVGKMWDVFLIILSILACAIYVAETYLASYEAVQTYSIIEMVVTQFFAADFVYNYLSAANTLAYLTDAWTFVDIITIVPVYITLALRVSEQSSHGVNLSVFRFVRILRLIRIMRMFKLLNGLSGVQRQLVTLSLTLVSLVFMAAGIIHIMENDLKQAMYYQCNFIGSKTNWLPSCDPNAAYDVANPGTCDCRTKDYTCQAVYGAGDLDGQPQGISCSVMTFLDAFYFLVVTVSTVGYGDMFPTTQVSRAVVVLFIITSVVLIPMQVNELTVLLAANSVYRQPYQSVAGEAHVIICGYITDWRKLEKFLKEFFHPNRATNASPDFHVVILSPMEPSDDLKSQLLYSSHLDGKVTYIIGSSLSTDDLQKARADLASAMFFFCNAETPEENSKLDDAATVLRTLSVSNFNPSLECFVQVLKPEDRDILKDSEVDVILCLDEYKTCVQARNAIVPGISTLVENLFHSFADTSVSDQQDGMQQWKMDYSHGASMEPYYIPLVPRYCELLSYEWTLMVEGIYLEYGCLVLGVASSVDHSLLLNPGKKEMKKFEYNSRFFKHYNMMIILATEQSLATSIASGMDDPQVIDRMLNKLLKAEETFTVRRNTEHKFEQRKKDEKTEKNKLIVSSLRDIIRVTKSWSGLQGVHVNPDENGDDDEYAGYIAKVSKKGPDSAKKLASLNRLSHAASAASGRNRSSSIDEESESESSSEDERLSGKPLPRNRGNSTTVTHINNRTRRASSFNGKALANAKSQLLGVGTGKKAFGKGTMEEDSYAVTAAVVSATGGNVVNEAGEEIIDNLIDDANDITGHVVVFGCMANLILFLVEMRRPIHSIDEDALKTPVVVIDDAIPPGWNFIAEAFENVYLIKGKMTRSVDFNRTNISAARSVALLAGRDHVTKVEEENLDAEALFAYLKLEKYIPREVFFTVELTCVSNMAVLNSTVVRRSRMKSNLPAGIVDVQSRRKKKDKPKVDSNDKVDMSKGVFSSHKALMRTAYYENLSRGIMNIIATVPARRISSLESKENSRSSNSIKRSASQKMANFWTTSDSHHMLSVFASGNAFVPATFDSILAQSFYTAFTPLLCETLVCGSKYQSLYQIDVPMPFIGQHFVHLYRAFMSRSLLVIAIYRAPMTTDGSTLPFVYTSPKPDTQLRFKDRIFVWCSPDQLRENLPMLKENLKEFADGSVSMADTLGVQVGDTTVDNRHKEQQEEAKSSNDQNLHTSGSDDAQYKYLLPSVEGTNASPLKQSVSRVYFEGTDIPL